jgi:hypothetical protein
MPPLPDIDEIIKNMADSLDMSIADFRREFEDDLYRSPLVNRPDLASQGPQGQGFVQPRAPMGNIPQKTMLGRVGRKIMDTINPNEGPGMELPVRQTFDGPSFDDLSPPGGLADEMGFMSGQNRGGVGKRFGGMVAEEGALQGKLANQMMGGPAASADEIARAGQLGNKLYPAGNTAEDMVGNLRGLLDDVPPVGNYADDIFNGVANNTPFGSFAGAQGPIDEMVGGLMKKGIGALPQGAQSAIGGAFSKVAPILGPLAAAGNAANIVGLTQMAGVPASPGRARMTEQDRDFSRIDGQQRFNRSDTASSMRQTGLAKDTISRSAASADRAMLNSSRRASPQPKSRKRKSTPLLRRSKSAKSVSSRVGSGFRK